MVRRAKDPVARYFFYVHVDGSTHLKRYFDVGDIDEMVQSDLVETVYEVTRDQWELMKQDLTPEQRVSRTLSGVDPRRIEGGMIARLK